MNLPSTHRRPHTPGALALAIGLASATGHVPAVSAAVHVWSGAAGGKYWSMPGNWSTGGVPSAQESGCVIEFPNAFTGPCTNNIPGLRVDALRFFGSGVTLHGTANVTLTLTGASATNLHNAGLNHILGSLPVVLEGTNRINAALGFGFYNRLSGTGGLEIRGSVRLDGDGANAYTGRTVLKSGLLTLGKEVSQGTGPLGLVSVPGPLVIEEGAVIYASDNGVADTAPIEIQPGGTLDLKDHHDTVGPLTLTGGSVETGLGVLTLGGTVWARAFGAVLNGRISLGGETRTFETDALATLVVNAAISTGTGLATAGVAKTGGGNLRLAGNNTFNGSVQVYAGTVEVAHPGALGLSFPYGTTVAAGAVVRLVDGVTVGSEPLTLNGGSLYGQGQCAWAGPVTLAVDAHLRSVTAGGELQVNGVIQGEGGFTHAGPGRLALGGATANSYAGDTRVEQGTVHLRKPDNVRAVSGRLIIGRESTNSLATVRLYGDYPLGSPSRVTLQSDGVLEVNGRTLSIGDVGGDGRIHLGNGVLVLSGGDYAGSVTGTGAIRKRIHSTLRLSGTNTYSGSMVLESGTLIVDGAVTAATVKAEPGTWVGGRGSIHSAVLDQATLSPGSRLFETATLQFGSLVMTNQSTYRYETQAFPLGGWDRDSVEVAGLARVTGTRLDIRLGGIGASNIAYLVMKLTGPDAIQGTFAGWPQDGVQTVAGARMEMDYFAGTGNDVVLRQRTLATNDFDVTLQLQKPDRYTTYLSWPGFASTYALETCTNLTENVWTTVMPYRGSDGTNIIAYFYEYPWIADPPQRFFRLHRPEY